VCRFGGHVIASGFYDQGSASIKCIVPPLSSMPFLPDDEYQRKAQSTPKSTSKATSKSTSEALERSSMETRGDVYYGDGVWGRSNAAFLEVEKNTAMKNNVHENLNFKNKIQSTIPTLCWGTSPCALKMEQPQSLTSPTLVHSNVRDEQQIDMERHMQMQLTTRHRCSSLLNDGKYFCNKITKNSGITI